MTQQAYTKPQSLIMHFHLIARITVVIFSHILLTPTNINDYSAQSPEFLQDSFQLPYFKKIK